MSKGTNHERPGVYSSYTASSVVSAAAGAKTVAVITIHKSGQSGKIYNFTRFEQAAEALGAEEKLTRMIRLLFLNGAAAVVAVPVAAEENYQAAFDAVAQREDISIVVCDSTNLTVQQALRDSVKAASAARRERIALVGGPADETVAQLVERAQALNEARMILVAPPESTQDTTAVAAAVAGAIAGERDPAVPLGGAELKGITSLTTRYQDSEIDLLVRGGVTPVESVGGTVSVVRGVTTRTKNGSSPDSTWRELTTILIADDVIPTIRNSLRAKFPRAKNTEQSRGAIRSQVILELENKLAKEIITGYENVTVLPKADNPTVCLVDFSFTVTHGLNQIWLTAHITV